MPRLIEIDSVLDSLDYRNSPNYLAGDALQFDRDFGHVFRKAQTECRLQGAYVLKASTFERSGANVPVVYVCKADSEHEARDIHKKVWNQNSVPFLLVVSPGTVRLYPGFQYQRDVSRDSLNGALRVIDDFNDVLRCLPELHAESIDSGSVWEKLAGVVTPEQRVDWRLLRNLQQLNIWLQEKGGVGDPKLAHGMIGKFVYIHYLRQRKILSNTRLREWKIDPSHIFSHSAQLNSFIELVQHVDDWLNGAVFPLTVTKIRQFGAENLRKVASVFAGELAESGQLPLFDVYDFSLIPIETLSVIYEQFLHEIVHPSGKSEGEARGAYYTPVPVVNFMLDKLDARRRLEPGMRVLDPACGSGAFLVQCYRKMIERRRQEVGRRLRPSELGRLLTAHIFGLDIDEEACQIAELGLLLTLLDYVDPPDLTETRFQLPALRNQNVFHANAFDDHSEWHKAVSQHRFHWVIGNPPWKDLNPKKLDVADQPAWQWIEENRRECPIGGNQLAEAFAWRASEFLTDNGSAALLLPAMALFKYESTSFREAFLRKNLLWSVGNFANLAEVLFGGRSRLPAASFFYSKRMSEVSSEDAGELIEVYSPLLATQPASHSENRRVRRETWNIVVNSSDIQEIDYRQVGDGNPLRWKIAMWGTPIDGRILATLGKKFRTIGDLEQADRLTLSQGVELRSKSASSLEKIEAHPELIGKQRLEVSLLKEKQFLIRVPREALSRVLPARTYVRKGRFEGPYSVCQPPHIVVSETRNFSVYVDDFLLVPHPQIGISSPQGDRRLLQALALYLNSDFVIYHQFLTTPQAGIQKSIHTLRSLRDLPVPFESPAVLREWQKLYVHITEASTGRDDFDNPELLKMLNDLTAQSLGLSDLARMAIDDLVHLKIELVQGKSSSYAVAMPQINELQSYAQVLRDQLDTFIGTARGSRHFVEVLFAGRSGLVKVKIVPSTEQQAIHIVEGSEEDARSLLETREQLEKKLSQWRYFQRNLRIYDGPSTYLLKPIERLNWTRTQAARDAGEIIGDALEAGSGTLVGAAS